MKCKSKCKTSCRFFMDEIVIFIPQIICFVRMCSYMDGSMQCYPYVIHIASSIQCCCHLDFLEYLKTKSLWFHEAPHDMIVMNLQLKQQRPIMDLNSIFFWNKRSNRPTPNDLNSIATTILLILPCIINIHHAFKCPNNPSRQKNWPLRLWFL